MTEPTRDVITGAVRTVTLHRDPAPGLPKFTLELEDGSSFAVTTNIGELVLDAQRRIVVGEFEHEFTSSARFPRSQPLPSLRLAVEDDGGRRRVFAVQLGGEGPWLSNDVADTVVRGAL